jgi:hypothetical protein
MCSSKKKSLKQKNDSNIGGGEYWKFDEFSSQMREPVIKSYAEKVIAHAAANCGICRQGFVKDLVDKAAQVAPLLKITCDNISNKVRNIKGPREHQEVIPMIPYHAIGSPTLFFHFGLKYFFWFDFQESECREFVRHSSKSSHLYIGVLKSMRSEHATHLT